MTDPRIERIAKQWSAATAASRMAVLPLLDAEATTDAEVAAVVDLFDGFDAEKRVYKVGEVVAFGGVLFRCVQAHTSQADWTPDKVPALWTPVRETKGTTPDPFVQPTGAADAYKKGDRVTFEGKVYESTIDANVWSPSAYPAGWKVV